MPSRKETLASVPINGFVMKRYLVYHIDEDLCVVSREAMDYFTLILTRKDRIDQGGEFMWGKLVFDQAVTGCDVEVEKGEPRSNQYSIRDWRGRDSRHTTLEHRGCGGVMRVNGREACGSSVCRH